MSQPNAFIHIDLIPSHFVLNPTHYTLRHGFWKDNVNLRRWAFEASLDGEVWDTLSIHDKDESLGGEYGTHTWTVKSEKWYRCFRIITLGKFFIQVCGMELYGNLLPRTLDAAFHRSQQQNSRNVTTTLSSSQSVTSTAGLGRPSSGNATNGSGHSRRDSAMEAITTPVAPRRDSIFRGGMSLNLQGRPANLSASGSSELMRLASSMRL
jgi:hypothetical protein